MPADKPAAGLKILLADDSKDFCESMKLLLESEGYGVRCERNGAEALAAQRAEPADVLITDLFMPERDGFETIESFRREFPATRIAVVSGGSRRVHGNYLESASLIGIDAAFGKPVEPPEVLRWLRELRFDGGGGKG